MTGKPASTSYLISAAVIFLLGALIVPGCGDDSGGGTAPDTDKTHPTVSLSVSSNLLLSDGDIVYTAAATDNKGVVLVEFYDEGVLIGSDDTAPFTHTAGYTETENGVHDCWATAKDAAGNSANSDTIDVIVAINVTAEFTNPGFTIGPEGWTLHNFDPWSGWTDASGNPPGCFMLNEFGSCGADPGIQQEVSGFVPGLTYEISGEYRPFADTYGDQYAESFVVTVDSVLAGSFARGPNGLAWSTFTAEFTATGFTHTIGFWAEYNCDDSSYEIDNVSLSIKVGMSSAR